MSFKLQWFYAKESQSPVPQDENIGETQTLSKWIFSNLKQYTKNVHLFLVITASNPAVRVQFHRFFVKKTLSYSELLFQLQRLRNVKWKEHTNKMTYQTTFLVLKTITGLPEEPL